MYRTGRGRGCGEQVPRRKMVQEHNSSEREASARKRRTRCAGTESRDKTWTCRLENDVAGGGIVGGSGVTQL